MHTVFRETLFATQGRFRQLLGPDFDAIGDLLDRLGVKRFPDHQDARDVLTDIAREQDKRFHLPVEDEEDLAVIWRCWQMLDDARQGGYRGRHGTDPSQPHTAGGRF